MNTSYIYFISIIFFFSGYAHASLEEVMVAGKKLSLDNETCLLTIDGKILKTEMKPRCYFIKQSSYPIKSKKIGVKYYADINSHVVLIIGTTISKDSEFPLSVKRDDCGKQKQALIINKNTALLSSKIFYNSFTCAGIGVDEKQYYILSHP